MILFILQIQGCATTTTTTKSLQLCPTLCDPIDSSLPGSPVPGVLQARTLEWVAISFSNAWKGKVKVKSLSRVRPLVTPWTAAYQAPPSMGFSRQEYWSGLPFPGKIQGRSTGNHESGFGVWQICVWFLALLFKSCVFLRYYLTSLSLFPHLLKWEKWYHLPHTGVVGVKQKNLGT